LARAGRVLLWLLPVQLHVRILASGGCVSSGFFGIVHRECQNRGLLGSVAHASTHISFMLSATLLLSFKLHAAAVVS
jgi:hypothetical protein